jgi:putative membrane protein insertion efficiency factor
MMITKLFILPIRFYQLCISPLLPKSCRYDPTCSEYAIGAINKYGIIRGLFMALKRILRCHPIKYLGGGSGYDPIK